MLPLAIAGLPEPIAVVLFNAPLPSVAAVVEELITAESGLRVPSPITDPAPP
jgi:hypothetical protein